jgi:hypothetical protein
LIVDGEAFGLAANDDVDCDVFGFATTVDVDDDTFGLATTDDVDGNVVWSLVDIEQPYTARKVESAAIPNDAYFIGSVLFIFFMLIMIFSFVGYFQEFSMKSHCIALIVIACIQFQPFSIK